MENSLPNRDHDMLVVLNTKVDQLTFDIKDIREDLISRVIRIESRLDAVDIYHAQIPLKQYQEIADWAVNFRANLKFITTIGGISVALLGAVLARFLERWIKF